MMGLPEARVDPPLVAFVCGVPLLCEAVAAALENVADVRQFPAGRGDTLGLLRWLQPDAVVVDTEGDVEDAASFAREANAPLVHVLPRQRRLRILRNGDWEEAEDGGASVEAIRNAVVGGLFRRRSR
ncbi:MAG: hypothetical protein M3312_11650 [Actinomycetota bacterium]|nr:hypothetical protein [Actinomycetota bacterium]